MGQREVEVARPERGLGAAGGQLAAGAPAPTAAANSSPAPGIAGPHGLVGAAAMNTSAARAAGHPGAEETAGGGEDLAAAVELDLGERSAHLEPRRGRGALRRSRPRPAGRQHPSDGEAAARPALLRRARRPRRCRRRRSRRDRAGDEHLGSRGAPRARRDEQFADPSGQPVDGVAELLDQTAAARRTGRVRAPPRRVGTDLLESTRRAYRSTSPGWPAGLRQDPVDDASGGRGARSSSARAARACTPLRSSAPRTERRPPCASAAPSADMPPDGATAGGRRRARGLARRPAPRSRARSAGSSRWTSSRSSATRASGRRVGGQLPQHRVPGRVPCVGERVEQHALAGASRDRRRRPAAARARVTSRSNRRATGDPARRRRRRRSVGSGHDPPVTSSWPLRLPTRRFGRTDASERAGGGDFGRVQEQDSPRSPAGTAEYRNRTRRA